MSKLAIKLKDVGLAALLEEAGYRNPRQIRDATDEELLAVPGVGKAKLKQARKAFSKA